MKKCELDTFLQELLETHAGISDLVFSVGRPPQVEAFGELKRAAGMHEIASLTAYQVEQLALTMMGHDRRLLRILFETGSCDCSYGVTDCVRFRVNVFRQRGQFAVVMRKAQSEIPTIQSLQLPQVMLETASLKNGLVLVTGATGSGKTTTLAAVLDEINTNQAVHVVTLEDPIEFVHSHKRATFNQRELGADFDTYPNGLRAALRQAPKVILVGEMRDRETVEVALTAAETGHLVLSTLHTVDAGQSINRILGMFASFEQAQLRSRLASTIRYVASQRLVPREIGGRLLLTEIMGSNLRVREAITLGENENRTFYDIIEANASFGWMTFDQSIVRAFEAGLLNEETAGLYATRNGVVTRAIDAVKKRRGLESNISSGLHLDEPKRGGRRGVLGLAKS